MIEACFRIELPPDIRIAEVLGIDKSSASGTRRSGSARVLGWFLVGDHPPAVEDEDAVRSVVAGRPGDRRVGRGPLGRRRFRPV